MENMRRQGYEMSLSPPKVVFKRSKDDPNTILEPVEELVIDVDQVWKQQFVGLLCLCPVLLLGCVLWDDDEKWLWLQLMPRT